MKETAKPNLFSYALLLAIGSMGASHNYARADLHPLIESRKNIESKKELDAIKSLNRVPVKDPLFLISFEEQQKLLFKTARWNHFFGNARFYRYRVIESVSKFRSSFKQELIALEIFALAKHCIWKPAIKIGNRAIQQADSLKLPNDKIKKALNFIKLHQAFPKEITPGIDQDTPRSYFTNETLWKIKNHQLQNVRHPKNVRVLVKNKCSQTEEPNP